MLFWKTLTRWFSRLVMTLGLALLVVTFTPLVYAWATILAGPWNDPPGDVLIVLTGSILDEQTIGMNSYWRAVYAARLFQEEHFQEIIISGGTPGEPSAVPMKTFIVAQGVPSEAIRLDLHSASTRESAVHVTEMLRADPARYQGRRLVLLTSDYHMLRSYRSFRHAGATVLPRPIPDARKRYGAFWERWGIFIELLQETTKYAYYAAHGWL